MDQNVQRLLMVLQSHSPNGDAQEVCSNMVRLAKAGGATIVDVEKMLVNALHDGLMYGNWPWVVFITKKPVDRGIQIGDFNVQHNQF